MQFDPSLYKDEQIKKNKFDNNLPAGEYLLVVKYFIMKTAKNSGKDYMRALIQVLEGPAKDAIYWQFQMLDLTSEGTCKRLGWWCQSMGVYEPFNPADSYQLADAFLFRPFKAYVNRKRNRDGEYVNDIARFSLPKSKGEVTAEEVHILADHRERLEGQEKRFKDQRSGSDSDYDNSGSQEDFGYGKAKLEKPSYPGDEEIPF